MDEIIAIVDDEQGNPIVGAHVWFMFNSREKRQLKAVTDATGRATISPEFKVRDVDVLVMARGYHCEGSADLLGRPNITLKVDSGRGGTGTHPIPFCSFIGLRLLGSFSVKDGRLVVGDIWCEFDEMPTATGSGQIPDIATGVWDIFDGESDWEEVLLMHQPHSQLASLTWDVFPNRVGCAPLGIFDLGYYHNIEVVPTEIRAVRGDGDNCWIDFHLSAAFGGQPKFAPVQKLGNHDTFLVVKRGCVINAWDCGAAVMIGRDNKGIARALVFQHC